MSGGYASHVTSNGPVCWVGLKPCALCVPGVGDFGRRAVPSACDSLVTPVSPGLHGALCHSLTYTSNVTAGKGGGRPQGMLGPADLRLLGEDVADGSFLQRKGKQPPPDEFTTDSWHQPENQGQTPGVSAAGTGHDNFEGPVSTVSEHAAVWLLRQTPAQSCVWPGGDPERRNGERVGEGFYAPVHAPSAW